MDLQQKNYIGYFFNNKSELWKEVKNTLQKFQNSIYVVDEHSISEAKSKLNLEENVTNSIEILSTQDFFLREQVVRAKPVIESLAYKIKVFPTHDLVIFLEMTWAVRTPSGDIYLRELHEAFQLFLEKTPVTIICLYNESILLDEQLMLSLNSHPFIYTPDGKVANPYYLPHKIIRKNQVKLRFNHWLGNIYPAWHEQLNTKKEENQDEKNQYPLEKTIQTQVAQTSEGRWKIRFLGELSIHRENGELIDWNTKAGSTRKLKTIFAFLLIRGEKGASGEELADLLWPDSDSSEQGLNRLYHAIRYLRIVLEGPQKQKSSFIVHQGSNYFLRLPYDSWVDLPMFQELCAKGNEHLKENNLEQVKICYESAERLYSGDLFSDIPQKYIDNNENDWLWSKRYWYREMYHKLLYSLANINRQLGNLSLAIKYCDKVLAEDPSLEPVHREKLIALAESQRFDALHRQYRIYCESLKKFNLGQPSEDMRKLYLNLSRKN